jgi:STE24 endopeptidase
MTAERKMILTPVEAGVSAFMNAVTRKFEYEADAFALTLRDRLEKQGGVAQQDLVSMDDMGARLGRALITLHVKNLSTVWVDKLCVALAPARSHPAFFLMFVCTATRRTTIRTRPSQSASRRSR